MCPDRCPGKLFVVVHEHADEWHAAELHARLGELATMPGVCFDIFNDWALDQPKDADGRWPRHYMGVNPTLAKPNPHGTLVQQKAATIEQKIRRHRLALTIHGTEGKQFAFRAAGANLEVRRLSAIFGYEEIILQRLPTLTGRNSNVLGVELSKQGPITLDHIFKSLPDIASGSILRNSPAGPPARKFILIGGVTLKEARRLGLPHGLKEFDRLPPEATEALGYSQALDPCDVHVLAWDQELYSHSGFAGDLMIAAPPIHPTRRQTAPQVLQLTA